MQMYADDLVVFSPSSAGLQELNICTEYGLHYDIKYNAIKSAILICRTKQDKQLDFSVFNCPKILLGFIKR